MEFGRVTGVDKPISRLAHGTMMLSVEELETGFELLDAVYDAGCRCWDSAHLYAGGDSERVLGQWSEARGNRAEIVILTKGCHHTPDRRRVTPFDLTSELHDSLARLHTDYIDIYVLHRDDPNVEVGPIVETLNEHHAAGRFWLTFLDLPKPSVDFGDCLFPVRTTHFISLPSSAFLLVVKKE